MTTLGLNAVASVGMSLLGVRNDPHVGFRFHVEFDGLIVGGFTEVTGLVLETTAETYREGGLNEYEHKLAGPTRYPSNLILKHGLTDIDTLWQWHQEIVQGKITRKNGSIYILGPDILPVMWWDVKEAYPIRWTGPELKAESNAVAFESLELVHRGISKPAPSGLVGALGGLLTGSASAEIGGAASAAGSFSL